MQDCQYLLFTSLFVLYILLFIYTRLHCIIRPNSQHLSSYILMIETWISSDDEDSSEASAKNSIVRKISMLLDDVKNFTATSNKSSFTLFSGFGRQLAGWRLAHEAERIALELLSDEELHARATVLMANLKTLAHPTSDALISQITAALEQDSRTILLALLREGLTISHNQRDSYFESLADWQNKSAWLIITASILILAVVVVASHQMLLILGAVGGLLSRLRKALGSQGAGFDYGVSWSAFFLAPLVGALTGWVGVLLLSVLSDMNIVGNALLNIDWNSTDEHTQAMLFAVLFGYSATLFDKLVEQAEAAVTKKNAGK